MLYEVIGSVSTVTVASVAAATLYLKRRQDRLFGDKKLVIETEAAQVEIARNIASMVREQYAEEKLEWAEQRGALIANNSHLAERVTRLERQHDLDVVSAATHRAWDDQAHQLALEIDKDFPPPPPIFHGEPKLQIDSNFDAEIVAELDGVSDEPT